MSSQPASPVHGSVELRLLVPGAEPVPLPVTLRYDPADPYAVQAVFAGEDVAVEWVLGRDLLLAGLQQPSGEGDVQVWPVQRGAVAWVVLALSSPDGHAVLEGDALTLEAFLRRTLAVVPAGAESALLDMDLEIDALLTT